MKISYERFLANGQSPYMQGSVVVGLPYRTNAKGYNWLVQQKEKPEPKVVQ